MKTKTTELAKNIKKLKTLNLKASDFKDKKTYLNYYLILICK